MSLQSSTANYGGRINEVQQNIKQFVTSSASSTAAWIYKRWHRHIVQTPANAVHTVLIENDLLVTGSLYVGVSPFHTPLNPSNPTCIPEAKLNALLDLCPVYTASPETYSLSLQELETLFPELIGENHLVNERGLLPLIIGNLSRLQTQLTTLTSQLGTPIV